MDVGIDFSYVVAGFGDCLSDLDLLLPHLLFRACLLCPKVGSNVEESVLAFRSYFVSRLTKYVLHASTHCLSCIVFFVVLMTL